MCKLKIRSNFLEPNQCYSIKESLKKVELYLQIMLVDVVVHFAEEIKQYKNLVRDGNVNWSKRFGLTMALVLLMRRS